MSITSDYVDFCLDLQYDDLPPEVISYAKHLFLDFIGIAAYGSRADPSRAIIEFIRALNGSGDCTALGTGEKLAPHYAALANGVFVKPYELDDIENSCSLHPGAAVWPVIMALGERHQLAGETLLPAVILGYETIIRLGQAINYSEHYDRGFHPSSTCGHFAATITASKLLGLSKQQTVNALGISGSQTSGSLRYILEGSWTKAFHSGWAAHSGILAAQLAQKGFNGPSDIFEGKYGFLQSYSRNTTPDLILKDLGDSYRILRTGIKLYTACRHEHPALDAILAIVRENDLKSEDIQRVEIYMIGNAFRLVVAPEEGKRAPQNPVVAMHSMYFGAAMAILRRRVFIEEHTEEWIAAAEVKELIRKIHCYHDPELDKMLPEKFPARAIIKTINGKQFEKIYEIPQGDGLNPLSLDELREKYRPLAESVFSPCQVQEIEKQVLRLEAIRNFNDISKLFQPGDSQCS